MAGKISSIKLRVSYKIFEISGAQSWGGNCLTNVLNLYRMFGEGGIFYFLYGWGEGLLEQPKSKTSLEVQLRFISSDSVTNTLWIWGLTCENQFYATFIQVCLCILYILDLKDLYTHKNM